MWKLAVERDINSGRAGVINRRRVPPGWNLRLASFARFTYFTGITGGTMTPARPAIPFLPLSLLSRILPLLLPSPSFLSSLLHSFSLSFLPSSLPLVCILICLSLFPLPLSSSLPSPFSSYIFIPCYLCFSDLVLSSTVVYAFHLKVFFLHILAYFINGFWSFFIPILLKLSIFSICSSITLCRAPISLS